MVTYKNSVFCRKEVHAGQHHMDDEEKKSQNLKTCLNNQMSDRGSVYDKDQQDLLLLVNATCSVIMLAFFLQTYSIVKFN
jgi:hypothetical protein